VGKKLLGCGVLLVAKCKFAEASERTGMVGVAGQDVFEERLGFIIVMGVESKLAKLKVGLSLPGLKADRGFELAAGVLGAEERGVDISEAIVCARIVGARGEIDFVIAFSRRHLLLFGFEARECIEDGWIGWSQLLCGVQSFVGFGELTHFECLEAAIKL